MIAAASASTVPPVPPFLAAAAVLTSFDPASLCPAGEVADRDEALGELLLNSEPMSGSDAGDRWQLEDAARREVLHQLGRRGKLREALLANEDRPRDAVQQALEELILQHGRIRIGLDELPLERLLGLARASDWLTGAVKSLPPREELLARIERERLLEPFRRLLARGFVGRGRELARLHDFLRQGKPGLVFVIHGPGGVGKSTLLARFVLESVAPESLSLRPARPFPFAYLDVDRIVLDPRDPSSFAKEAARQLGAQSSSVRGLATEAQWGLVRSKTSLETVQLESAADTSEGDAYRLAKLAEIVANEHRQPVLFIVDTFEEVQAAGESSEAGVIRLLASLAHHPTLRIVCSGRAPLRAPDSQWPELVELPLEAFDEPTAEAYLGGVAGVPAEAVGPIINAVGTNPLSLALAARVVQHEGVEATADLPNLVAKVKAEQLQGQLYTRLLSHIHDEDVRQLAHPGLVVRRITPDVIRYVLAAPCGVTIDADAKADELFLKFAREVALVEPDENDEKIHVAGELRFPLRHRPDVRQLMLADMRRSMGERMEAIHAAAAGWYATQDGLRARAEEIYHQLAVGELPPNDRWKPGLDRWLLSSLPELPARGRAWLAPQLGRSLDPETRTAADYETWEWDTAEQVRAYLVRREWHSALALLRQREVRNPASPLWLLEVQALIQGRQLTEAEALLDRGVSLAKEHGELTRTLEFLLLLAGVKERRGEFETALATLREAEPFAVTAPELERLRLLVMRLRLLRKSASDEGTVSRVRNKALEFANAPTAASGLRRRPALLREAAAELGQIQPELVLLALEILGIGQVHIPSALAPRRVPGWLANLCAPLLSRPWIGRALDLLPHLRGLLLAMDLLTGSKTVHNAARAVQLATLAGGLLAGLRHELEPTAINWCVQRYRAEVEAILAGDLELGRSDNTASGVSPSQSSSA